MYSAWRTPPTKPAEKHRTTFRLTSSFHARRGSSIAVLSDITTAGTPVARHQRSGPSGSRRPTR